MNDWVVLGAVLIDYHGSEARYGKYSTRTRLMSSDKWKKNDFLHEDSRQQV
jgi:hypothetical protein